jgi:CRP-like cAMP-binding protein
MSSTVTPFIDPAFQSFFKQGRCLQFGKTQDIIRPEDDPDGIYFIQKGFVRAYANNSRGEEYTFIILVPGEVFPLNWLMHGTKRCIGFQSANSHATVYRVSREEVLEKSRTDPKFSFALLEKSLEQYSLFVDRVDNLEYKYASERLAYRLLYLIARFGEKRSDGSWVITIPISQQTIASSINVSRESVSREFERLYKKEYVAFEGKHIIIRDVEGLKQQFPRPLSPNWWGLSEQTGK